MRKMYLDAIQNVGCVTFIIGFAISMLFVHYIQSLYITGIILMVIGGVVIGVFERIEDKRKEEEYV